ncbi:glycosyltransferase [Bradyrhizobium zhanjiangense]|uniref:glycosyltransferase n=1 Tax=Bradyrhizobium zhanjiangense TaxID=1325107 RepID=UPI0013E8A027|nr:glycosyltransferase [Bradyrhizobium zhanjiangense]
MAAVALSLHHALLAQRVDAHLVCGLAPEQDVEHLYVAGRTVGSIGVLPKQLLCGVIHIHGLWTPFEYLAQLQARRSRAFLVISPHGALASRALDRKRLKKLVAWTLYQRRIVQRAHLLIANSEQEHDHLRRSGLTPPIAIIPNGVDGPKIPVTWPEGVSAERKKIVLFLARLCPTKGIPDLLEAWRGLEDRRGYELHIHGFGDAIYRAYLEVRIRQLGIGGHVKLLGPLYDREKWEKLHISSIYVLPSYMESFGITVAEALSAGLPVITTSATPWAGLAEKNLGWIVENDIGELRQALQEALSLSPSQLKAIADEARCYAQQFSWPDIAARYLRTYEWLCDAGPKPEWVSLV